MTHQAHPGSRPAPTSWVLRETATGKPIAETFNAGVVAALNTAKYEAVPILQHLQEVARAARLDCSLSAAPAAR